LPCELQPLQSISLFIRFGLGVCNFYTFKNLLFSPKGHVDGTIYSSNPSLTALAKAIATFPDSVGLQNSVVFSVGGPAAPQFSLPRKADWGLWQWAPWLVSLLFDSTVEASDGNMSLLLHDQYVRVVPPGDSHIPLDLTSR